MPKIQSLGVMSVMLAAKSDRDALIQVVASIDSWTLAEFDSKKKAAEAAMIQFEKSFSTLSDFMDPMKKAWEEAKSKAEKEKRNRANRIKGIAEDLVEGKVPKGVAQLFAKTLFTYEDRLKTSFYVPCGSSSSDGPKNFEYNIDSSSWAQPIGFLENHDTPIHNALQEVMTELENDKYAVVSIPLKTFETNEKAVQICSDLMSMFMLKEVPCGDFQGTLGEYRQLKTILVSAKNKRFSFKIESLPFAGTPGFLQCVLGAHMVAILPVASLLDTEGGSIEAIGTYLGQMGDEFLERQLQIVHLVRGGAVWVPPGYVPIVIGVDGQLDRRKKEELAVSSFLWHGMLTLGQKLTAEVSAEVKSWIEKAIARKLNSLTGDNQKALQQYADGLKLAIAAPKVVG